MEHQNHQLITRKSTGIMLDSYISKIFTQTGTQICWGGRNNSEHVSLKALFVFKEHVLHVPKLYTCTIYYIHVVLFVCMPHIFATGIDSVSMQPN